MLSNYLKIAVRYLLRHKGYSFINIFGLAVGIASFILISLYVYNEMTYDTFHQNADQIYLIHRIDKSYNNTQISATSPDPLPETLKNDYPDLMNVVRFFGNEFPVTAKGKTFKEKFLCTCPAVFKMFTFPLIKGNPETALENVNSIVVTQELANKYFGDEDPMGKTMTLLGQYDFIITGVLKKIPQNSSIKFGMLLPEKVLKNFMPDFGKQWSSSGSYTFVQFSEKMMPVELENQFPYIIDKYVPDWYKDRLGLGLQPLTDIHLKSNLVDMRLAPTNSASFLYTLLAIAIAVLVIASINFVNLSMSRFTERAKEVGIRKVLGALRIQLIKQYIGESILLSFLALILGLGLAELFLPEFNILTGKDLVMVYNNKTLTLTGIIGFGLLIGIFSGIYPAFFLSAYNPIAGLKIGGKAVNFRRALVITQFTISTLLIICVLVVAGQLLHMKNHELGFNSTNMLAIPTHTNDLKNPLSQINTYLNAINTQKENLGITAATVSENIPGYYYQNTFGVVPEGSGNGKSLEMIVTSIDENFLAAYQIKLVEGRNFSREFGTDKYNSILLNETAVKKIGWQSAVDKEISYVHGDGPYKIIGVVNDIHFKSLQNKIEPLVYRFSSDQYKVGFITVRIHPENLTKVLTFLKEQWQYLAPNIPFDYFFLADKYAGSYKAEEKVLEIIGLFSLLAILLACLGLLGLAALTVTQRTKEIGVRKAIGASIVDIVSLISKQFIKLVLLANLIAWPIAYFVMKNWLQNYPYHINIGVGTFFLGGVLVLLIALLTLSYQAVKAALANPVEALKYE